ncbi:MAG: helix-turn-helix transcriptional regulator [Candidatus Saccharicenans sp.]
MEKILILSSKTESQLIVKDIVGESASITILHVPEASVPTDDISLILTDCDYQCRLDKCLKKFLFVHHHKSTPAVILKPVLIKNGVGYPGFFFRILNNTGFAAIQKDWLSLMKNSKYYAGSPTFLVLPFSPLSKIIAVQRIIIESDHVSFQLKDLARIAGCSSSWLSVNFRQLAGISLRTFRARERCCRALWQLVSTDKPIKTIALEAGYEPLYFSQLFHKLFKAPPSSVRILIASGKFPT